MKVAFNIRAHPGVIYQFMAERKLSVKALAGEIGISYGTMLQIMRMRWSPKPGPGRGKARTGQIIQKLERYFSRPLEDLLPMDMQPQQRAALAGGAVIYEDVELVSLEDIDQRLMIDYHTDARGQETVDNLYEVLLTLTPREEKVVRLIYGMSDEVEKKLFCRSCGQEIDRNIKRKYCSRYESEIHCKKCWERIYRGELLAKG